MNFPAPAFIQASIQSKSTLLSALQTTWSFGSMPLIVLNATFWNSRYFSGPIVRLPALGPLGMRQRFGSLKISQYSTSSLKAET